MVYDRRPQPAWRKNNSNQNKSNKKNYKPRNSKSLWPELAKLGPLEVIVYNNDINQALRILKNKISNDGILQQLKSKRYSEKKSEKKRRKHREFLKRERKNNKPFDDEAPKRKKYSRSKVFRSVAE